MVRVSKRTKTPLQRVVHHVGRNVKLGRNVKIWHFAYVGDNTAIGDNVVIGSLTHVDYDVKIGSNSRIEGMVYIPPRTRIGKDVFVGPGVVFTNDPYPPSKKWAGVVVDDGAIIGAGAVIKAGVTVGSNSVVAMGAVVVKDVPPFSVVMGLPSRVTRTREEYDLAQSRWEREAPSPERTRKS